MKYKNGGLQPRDIYLSRYKSEVIKNNGYRKVPEFLETHFKTFRASVYKKIPISYLIDYNGEFYKLSTDMAEMYSVLELSGEKQMFVNDISYCYNIDNSSIYQTFYSDLNKSSHNKEWENYRSNTIHKIRNTNSLKTLKTILDNIYDINLKKVNFVIKTKNISGDMKKLIDILYDNKYDVYIDSNNLRNKKLKNNKYTVYLDKFISIENIKKYIKYIEQTKLNVFYIHPNLNGLKYNYITFDEDNIVVFKNRLNKPCNKIVCNKIVCNKNNKKLPLCLGVIETV